MSTKGWIVFVGVVIAVFGGLIYLSGKDNVDVSSVHENEIIASSEQTGNIAEHVFGNAKAKVILVEYGDFQCPACGGAHPNIKRITEQYKDKLAFVFRNFPLTTIHPNARAGAAAVEAAGLQGKYWEMHNGLYESQNEWSESDSETRTNFFVSKAKEVGVKDIEKFKKDLSSSSVNKKISFDQALGKKIGANATPTLVLNGEQVSDEATNDAVQGGGTKLEEKIKELIKD